MTSGVIGRLCCAALLGLGSFSAQCSLTYTPWAPIFQGIEHSFGSNCPPTTLTVGGATITDSALQTAHCLKIDLQDPGVRLFTTPRAPGWVAESRETLSLSISNFIRNYKVQVASDANFYCINQIGCTPDATAEGLPSEVHGFLVCTGQVVSPVDSQGRYASLLFTSNKEPSFNLNNRPPGSSLTNVYTAVTGFYPILTNGVNVWALYYNDFLSQYPDQTIHGFQPRTAFGISQDKRYLFMMTIDGRQPSSSGGGSCGNGYSNGALDAETAMWLQLFGAWDAINMDGGGSTAMYMADCAGEPIALNHSSLLSGRSGERLLGCHFGVYAKPLPNFVSNVVVNPTDSTATLTFQTPVRASVDISYGPTTGYGSVISNPNFLTKHALTLNGLNPSATYYFQITCNTEDGGTYDWPCKLTTATPGSTAVRNLLFDVTKSWRYYSNNLDGVNWQAPAYNDASWYGPSPGLLWIDNPNTAITPKGTQIAGYNTLTPTAVSATHYFRTHFSFPTDPAGVTLYFTNYLDDAAVFYLNGAEVQRIRMSLPPTNITYTSTTDPVGLTHCGNGNDATCPDIFLVSGALAQNLVQGDNVVAVELHQATVGNTDMAFGAALAYSVPQVQQPQLNILSEDTWITVYWNGSGFTLQYADDPGGPWTDVPGPITTSTFELDSPGDTRFFRLRN